MPDDKAAVLRNTPPDTDAHRLRTFIDKLAASGQLEIVDRTVALADLATHLEGNPQAVLFTRAGPENAHVVGNVMGGRARLAAAFGVPEDALIAEVMRRVREPQPVTEVAREDAPVQEVVRTGEDADLTRLPVPFQHGRDGGPYFSATLDFVTDPATGRTNVGCRRLMLRGRRTTGIDLQAPSDLRAIYQDALARGERLPVAFVVGAHPADHVAGTMRVPMDETELVARLRGAPLAIVKCLTNDVRVPADAEIVLEGYIHEDGYNADEGPYGEFLGYYGVMKQNPLFHVTAVTMRRDALFQTTTISGRSMQTTDNAYLNAIKTETSVWSALETAVRDPVAVYATEAAGGMFNLRISLRQRVPGESRNAIAAAFGCMGNVKNVFVVDDDVDIFDDGQMEWALATRFQPDRDLVVESGFRVIPLDPSLAGTRTGAKAGFDLTWPFGQRDRLEYSVPAPPEVEGRRFDSVRTALEDGAKTFEQLMAAVGTRDGRDVVVALEALRQDKALVRTSDGGYALRQEGNPE